MSKDFGSRRLAVEHLYQRISERSPMEELLEIVHDEFGDGYGLRPPILQVRLASLLAPERRANG